VTCGITFTFGGLKIDTSGRVIDTDGQAIAGLHAAGELVGGFVLFQLSRRHWPDGGLGLGRIAGTTAASERHKHRPSSYEAISVIWRPLPQAIELDGGSRCFRRTC